MRPVFSSRPCAGPANAMSLFMPDMDSRVLQWRFLLFWALIPLCPVLICARIVHSQPPFVWSSCQLHLNVSHPLRLKLNLRIFSSSSDSTSLVSSSRADIGVHSSSEALVHLMCSGRFGRSLFLTQTRISLCSSLSRDKTGQIFALANSCPGGTEIPKEVKKELCTSERVLFLLLPRLGCGLGRGAGLS